MNLNYKIDGHLACCLADAAAHLARLEVEFNDLQWRIFFRPDLSSDCHLVKKHCRKLLNELGNIEGRLQDVKEMAADNVVVMSAEKDRLL